MSFSELFNLTRIRQAVSTWIIKKIQRYGPKRVEVIGRVFEISEDVFNPRFYFTSRFMARHIEAGPDDEVLDMGTGSGIQAIIAAEMAKRVVAVDINPEAVKFARRNVRLNSLEDKVTVLEGDLFESLMPNEKFDIIIFTPPYMEGSPSTDFEFALYDKDKRLIKRFFTQAGNYLKHGGYVQMLYSSIAEPSRVVDIVRSLGWEYYTIAEMKTFTETFMIYRLVPEG
jgi:HemK-related putative methylase